jgi:hypothetical protein
MEKLRTVYKDKFSQLKNAYNEVEREKDSIKVNKNNRYFYFNDFLFPT